LTLLHINLGYHPKICGYYDAIPILSLQNASQFNYTQYIQDIPAPEKWNWTVVVTFMFRKELNSWSLDDVFLAGANGSNLLLNAGFEETNSPWYICNPSNSSSSGHIGTSDPHNGSYCYMDGAQPLGDYLSQTVTTINELNYTLSFWLANDQSPDKANEAVVTILLL
jgi:hypothetical protein